MVSADQNRINYLPRTDTIDHYNDFKVKLSTYIVYCGSVTRNPHDKMKTDFAILENISQGWQTCLDISKERKDFFLNMNTYREDRQRFFSLPLLAAKLNLTPL